MFDQVQILGPFNSGTNLMKILLEVGFDVDMGRKGQLWVWKHTYQLGPRKLSKMKLKKSRGKGVLNIVMVRDPYFWFQSIQKAPYTIRWNNGIGSRGNSVNLSKLVKTGGEMSYCPKVFNRGIEKKMGFDKLVYQFQDLVQLWNHYYSGYNKAMKLLDSNIDGGKLIFVRYEDLVESPELVISRLSSLLKRQDGVSDSMIIEALHPPSKNHGSSSGRELALLKLKNPKYRKDGLDVKSMQFIKKKIDHSLMNKFEYSQV